MQPGLRQTDVAGVRTLLLDRPERANALDGTLIAALTSAVRSASGAKLVVVRGSGRHFSAGFDLAATPEIEAVRARFLAIQDLLDAVRQVPSPTLAVVHGAAVGAGADLAVACDLRVGTTAASFRFPGLQFGVSLGQRQLRHRVGPDRALELGLLGTSLDAPTARSWGLLTHLADNLEAADMAVAEIADRTRGMPATAVARLLNVTRLAPDPLEHQDLLDSLADPDLVERLAAYRERYRRAARS